MSKYFESTLSKMISPLMPSVSANTAVAIYITKFLAAPFKQLEIYVKILKEIHRYTEDYHIDRGDLQRCIEFYSTLLLNVQETRKKKEYELDILSSKINNLDTALSESLLKNTEVLFISTVLVVNGEHGEIRDRIMLILPSSILFLKQSATNEFDFDFKINLSPSGQIRKIADLETVNSFYGGNLINSTLISSYLFEIVYLNMPTTQSTRLLIACPTNYDMKHSFDLISTLLAKSRAQQQQQQQVKTSSSQTLVRQASAGSATKQMFHDSSIYTFFLNKKKYYLFDLRN